MKIYTISAFWCVMFFLSNALSFLNQNPVPVAENEKPKNIVLMIGDGMGVTQVALMYYRTHAKGPFYLDSFPVVGLQKTHSYSNVTTDSGASATAMASGYKTYNSAIGLGSDTTAVKNIMERCAEKDYNTGLVVTSSLTDATPGAFVAHEVFRGFKEQIAVDYLDADIDFIAGGGAKYFYKRHLDDRNLLNEFKKKGYKVSFTESKNFLKKITPEHDKYFFLTAEGDPEKKMNGREYFPYAVESACLFLEEKEKPFFIMSEASQVDYACHQNGEVYLIMELIDFNNAIGRAFQFAKENKETLVLVTGDHECGDLIINPSHNREKPKFQFNSNKHTPQMIPIFAYGPGSEHFNGIFENTEISKKINYLLNLD